MIVAGILLALLFVVAVVVPGVARGGWAEVAGVLAIIGAILLGERLLRRVGR